MKGIAGAVPARLSLLVLELHFGGLSAISTPPDA